MQCGLVFNMRGQGCGSSLLVMLCVFFSYIKIKRLDYVFFSISSDVEGRQGHVGDLHYCD